MLCYAPKTWLSWVHLWASVGCLKPRILLSETWNSSKCRGLKISSQTFTGLNPEHLEPGSKALVYQYAAVLHCEQSPFDLELLPIWIYSCIEDILFVSCPYLFAMKSTTVIMTCTIIFSDSRREQVKTNWYLHKLLHYKPSINIWWTETYSNSQTHSIHDYINH